MKFRHAFCCNYRLYLLTNKCPNTHLDSLNSRLRNQMIWEISTALKQFCAVTSVEKKIVFRCAEFLVFFPSVLPFFPSLLSLAFCLSYCSFLLSFISFIPRFFSCYFLISPISGTNHSSLPLQILYQRFLV